MYEIFENYILSRIALTSDELQLIRSLSVSKRLRRKQFLLQEGEVARHKIFVCQGLIKTYLRKEDGSEYILRFAPEHTWTTDHESYSNQIPSKLFIDALEDSAVVVWTKENFEALLEAIPAFKAYTVTVMARSLDAVQNRILGNISYTNEEKYQDFVNSFPDVFQRVPLHMVASYLGVSRETLSRIRQAQAK